MTDHDIRELRDDPRNGHSGYVEAICDLALDGTEPPADDYLEPYASALRALDQESARVWCAEVLAIRRQIDRADT